MTGRENRLRSHQGGDDVQVCEFVSVDGGFVFVEQAGGTESGIMAVVQPGFGGFRLSLATKGSKG